MRTGIRPLIALAALTLPACGQRGGTTAGTEREVVVYSALDREFSEPILAEYAKSTGVRVLPRFDVESTKTVGLTQSIIAEAKRPRCDLFWNNEILNTLRLKKMGLLAPFRPKHGSDYPAEFRAADATWYGFAARARILLVNTDLVPEAKRPKRLRDLLDAQWNGRIGFAKPMFGTTATHACTLFAAWGDEVAKAFYRGLKANGIKTYAGNRPVAQAVGAGEIAVGMTDTDDAMLELIAKRPVVIVYPDRGSDELGTLFIPNTLAVSKGAPHSEEAEALANVLLSPATEATLARGQSAQIPLNPKTRAETAVETPRIVKPMRADWEKAVDLWDDVMDFLTSEFGGP